jgi:ParB family chromosome partitioning protein
VTLEPKRRVLGKGLGSLIPDSPSIDTPASSDSSASRAAGHPLELPIDAVHPNPYQPRQQFSDEEIANLAASIRESGILQPLVVRKESDDRYTLIAGERRLRAARKAGLQTVPVVQRETRDEHLLIEALIENIQRDDLDALETAQAFRELIRQHGMTQAELSQRIGKPRSSVANYLRLLDLPAEVQAMISARKLEFGHARALAAIEDPEDQLKLARIVVEKQLSVREIETRARLMSLGGAGDSQEPHRRDPNLVSAERALSRALEAKVAIDIKQRGNGTITIRFADEPDLDRLYRQLVRATPKGPIA